MKNGHFFALLRGAAAAPALVLAAWFGSDDACAERFHASGVADYSPGPGVTPGVGFGIVDRILGGPRGAGPTAGSLDVLTLGVGGSVTLTFDAGGRSRRIVDGPGPDLIVFENAMYVAGDPTRCFGELAFVEVSTDGVRFARLPSRSLTPAPVSPYGAINPADVTGLAGAHPTLANVDTNTVDPFDPPAAGGDAFDLAELADDPMVVAGLVRLNDIRFVRLVDILGDGSVSDGEGGPIYDPTGFQNSCDIDAISVIHGCAQGDVNDDGTCDATDAAALAAALLDPADAADHACADVNGDGDVDGEDIQALLNAIGQ